MFLMADRYTKPQIPSLRCGMTSKKKTNSTSAAHAKCFVFVLGSLIGATVASEEVSIGGDAKRQSIADYQHSPHRWLAPTFNYLAFRSA
jgi:hypothetical protein